MFCKEGIFDIYFGIVSAVCNSIIAKKRTVRDSAKTRQNGNFGACRQLGIYLNVFQPFIQVVGYGSSGIKVFSASKLHWKTK